jgi:hypothetical protein
VRRTRGWSPSQYRIDRNGPTTEGYVVYTIVFLEDLKPPNVAGGGSSFVAVYDPVRGEVVEEMAFQ